jgi:hypothetical protein
MKSRRMRWAGLVACIGNRRGAYRGLVGKPLRRSRYRWEDKTKINLK